MAVLPISFSPEMVSALLEGRKTMTRRVVTRLRGFRSITGFQLGPAPWLGWSFLDREGDQRIYSHNELLPLLPYQPGDLLYVREHWRTEVKYDGLKPSLLPTHAPISPIATPLPLAREGRFRQAMFMPKWATRLTLAVRSVKVEHVGLISAEDAIAEGVFRCMVHGRQMYSGTRWSTPENDDDLNQFQYDPRLAFADLWNSLHGEPDDGWGQPPYVAATTFDVINANVADVLERAAA